LKTLDLKRQLSERTGQEKEKPAINFLYTTSWVQGDQELFGTNAEYLRMTRALKETQEIPAKP